MNSIIVLLSDIIPWIVIVFLLTRVILYNYLNRQQDKALTDILFPIKPVGILLPIRKSNEGDTRKEKIIKLANLVLYFFYGTVLILLVVMVYGREQQLF